MNKQQFIKHLKNLEELSKNSDEILRQFNKLFGNFDGEVSDNIYDYQAAIVEILENVVGDTDNWVEWYIFERSSTAYSEDGLKYEITTPEELVEFCGWFGKTSGEND